MESPTLPLTLTPLEVIFLCDSIRNDDLAQGLPEKDAYYPLARRTLLLLGSAYGEVVSVSAAGLPVFSTTPVTLSVDEEVAWLLHSKVRTGDLAIDGRTNIGVALSLKLYALLLSFNADLSDLPTTDEAGPNYKDVVKEISIARTEPASATSDSPEPDADKPGTVAEG